MIGAKIRDYLKENGIKQKYLAEKTGIGSNKISDICIHDRKIECVEYYKICKALGLPLEYFLQENED